MKCLDACKMAIPSRRDGLIRSINGVIRSGVMQQTWNANHTVPYGTDSDWDLSQAINCLATIIQSLRDKVRIPRRVRPGQVRRAAGDISTICHRVICHWSC
jgi:hypothetical protein